MTKPSSRTVLTSVGLVTGGLIAGAVLAGTMSANASTASPSSGTPGASVTPGPTASDLTPNPEPSASEAQETDGISESAEPDGHGPDLSGVVTAVGSASVTIQSSSGTTTYTIDDSSDIDKSGEAKLSDLVVGDRVTYSVVAATTTIDKLHAGDETLNHPGDGDGGSESGTDSD